MPITPAHAAAVVPLCRWKPYLWLSPLVVGSMAPDFAYFVFLPSSLRYVGHTPRGLVVFCIPTGLAVLWAFHRIFKRPLVLLLPEAVRARLWKYCGPFPLLPLRRLIWVSLLIFLGAATHVVWDAFTHEDGWAVRDFPQRNSVMMSVAGQHLHWVGLFQYGSSALGLGLLAWWSWQWYRRTPAGFAPPDSPFLRQARPRIAAAILAFGIAVGIACGLVYACNLPGSFNVREFLAASFITGVDASGLAFIVFAAAVHSPVFSSAWEGRDPRRNRLLGDFSGTPRGQREMPDAIDAPAHGRQ